MVRLLGFILLLLTTSSAFAQTCTIEDPDGNPGVPNTVCWAGCSPTVTCEETPGLAPVSGDNLLVPAGIILDLKNSGAIPTSPTPFHIGNITIEGALINNKAQSQLDGNITIKSGGTLILDKIMYLGDAGDSPCPYNLTVETGGLLDLSGGGASDRIVICGNIVAQSGGLCNPYPAGPIPYCEPPGGFTGPFVFTDSGLPIELLFFKGSKGFGKISLTWATASELNFDYFDIEKSADGKNFQRIAKVTGHGTTNERQDYALDDEKPYIGKNYYRMKSVDFDGYTESFNVVLVEFDGSKAFAITPNPSDGITFTAETNFVPQTRAYVAIYSTLGSEIGRYEVSGNKSLLTLPVKLESGVYFAKYISGEFTSTNRVVVR